MAFLSGVLIVLAMLGTGIDVILRYLFNGHIENILSLIEFGLLYIAFLSAAWILKREKHVKVDFLVTRVSPRKQNMLAIFSSLIGIVICLVYVWYGTTVTWELWEAGTYDIFRIRGFPKAVPVAIIPIGSFVLLIQFFRRIVTNINMMSGETPTLDDR